jgi:hypothetical protein
MADRPMIFSAPMVRALLDGRKTQTRLVLNPQPDTTSDPSGLGEWGALNRYGYWSPAEGIRPYQIGDRLWVREAWRAERGQDRQNATEMATACLAAGYSRVWAPIFYDVDAARVNFENGMVAGRYRHSHFMPRWASRLTLIVTDVRVQRLQDISETDAVAEGAAPILKDQLQAIPGMEGHRGDFRGLWNSIHGPDAWDANPWVCALTFTVHRCNIDHLETRP